MKLRPVLTAVFVIVMVAYPFLVWWAIQTRRALWMSVVLVVVAVGRYALKPSGVFAPLSAFGVLCGGVSLLLQDGDWLKYYPVLMSVGSFFIFAHTLYRPPSMIERFARLHQPQLPQSGVRWTYRVTQVWCGFFVINAAMALITVLLKNDALWALYNGFISYVLMGLLLAGEWLLRRRHQGKSP